ncbi:hypothetical protein H8356DRAFT_1347391 [Neocallimastix lanati (nom. inval.)]|nr:hypothetical protein H8356DRAFT_1347391 [Neocallimastix sp. JGI-2020a]
METSKPIRSSIFLKSNSNRTLNFDISLTLGLVTLPYSILICYPTPKLAPPVEVKQMKLKPLLMELSKEFKNFIKDLDNQISEYLIPNYKRTLHLTSTRLPDPGLFNGNIRKIDIFFCQFCEDHYGISPSFGEPKKSLKIKFKISRLRDVRYNDDEPPATLKELTN